MAGSQFRPFPSPVEAAIAHFMLHGQHGRCDAGRQVPLTEMRRLAGRAQGTVWLAMSCHCRK